MKKTMIIEFGRDFDENRIQKLKEFVNKFFSDAHVDVTTQSVKIESDFRTYEGNGVCPFCGRNNCNGNCFK